MADVWWDEVVEKPLKRIQSFFGNSSAAAKLALQTREIAAPLKQGAPAWVFEHGDFSAPNLLLNDRGRPGVVDWELGTPHGLLASDLFQLLGFVARACESATTASEGRSALRRAFYGSNPWAADAVNLYASALGIRAGDLRALYVLTWARSVASYVERLHAESGQEQGSRELRSWLESDLSYAAWEDSISGFADLRPYGKSGSGEST
jgi:aminoglycoside phosphotransferase (APT) family kinase protein